MNTISELTDYLGLEDLLEDKEKLEREITRNFDNEQERQSGWPGDL